MAIHFFTIPKICSMMLCAWTCHRLYNYLYVAGLQEYYLEASTVMGIRCTWAHWPPIPWDDIGHPGKGPVKYHRLHTLHLQDNTCPPGWWSHEHEHPGIPHCQQHCPTHSGCMRSACQKCKLQEHFVKSAFLIAVVWAILKEWVAATCVPSNAPKESLKNGKNFRLFAM